MKDYRENISYDENCMNFIKETEDIYFNIKYDCIFNEKDEEYTRLKRVLIEEMMDEGTDPHLEINTLSRRLKMRIMRLHSIKKGNSIIYTDPLDNSSTIDVTKSFIDKYNYMQKISLNEPHQLLFPSLVKMMVLYFYL